MSELKVDQVAGVIANMVARDGVPTEAELDAELEKAVANGTMIRHANGSYSLTEKGEAYAKSVIMNELGWDA